jgi:hypothetical protein
MSERRRRPVSVRSKDVRKLLATLEDHGCTVVLGRGSHYRVTRPGYPKPVFFSSTPSDPRALDNMISDARKYLGVRL